MARTIKRLTALGVEALKKPGRYADGANLYLRIGQDGSKRFTFFYTLNKRQREAGLGSASTTKLADARRKAEQMRALLQQGIDPLDAKTSRRHEVVRATPTFGAVAEELLKIRRNEWSARHAKEWWRTLVRHASALMTMPVDQIDTDAVVKALTPSWGRSPETGMRVRARIETVLDAARARGLIPADRASPARWKGHLDHLLSGRPKLSKRHHTAMPYPKVPAFMAKLRKVEKSQAPALAFLILTAARSDEAIGATWSEIDIDARLWSIPATRMKAGKEHRVPLSDAALAIVARQAEIRTGTFVFPGRRGRRPVSRNSLYILARNAGVTLHGFRSSFRDWASDETDFPREIAEQALAHTVGTATERAYRRGDALEKRRELMAAWASYCDNALNAWRL